MKHWPKHITPVFIHELLSELVEDAINSQLFENEISPAFYERYCNLGLAQPVIKHELKYNFARTINKSTYLTMMTELEYACVALVSRGDWVKVNPILLFLIWLKRELKLNVE